MEMLKELNIAKKIASSVAEFGGTSYFVGGFVRDKLMGLENKDVDMEVHGITPETLEKILDSCGERIEKGKSFGVYNLKGYGIDIAMPRKEKCLGKGHRDFKIDVSPFIGTEKAAQRRDFTVNAIMENVLTGEITDYFGGKSDLEKKIVRHIKSETFVEDPLRVFRGAQFAARFGFKIAEDTKNLCRKMSVSSLAGERVFEEMKKALLKAERPSVFFEELKDMDVLDDWFSELKALIGVEQNKDHHKEGDAWNHTMMVVDECAARRNEAKNPLGLMIAALCHDFGKAVCTEEINGVIRALGHEEKGLPLVKEFVHRLTGDKKLTQYVLNMTELHMRPNMLYVQKSKIKSTNKLFDLSVEPADLIHLAMADNLGKLPREADENTEKFLFERLEIYKEYMSRDYVSGKDLIEMGISPGENFSKILEFSHKLRLSGVSKEEVIKQIKKGDVKKVQSAKRR